MAEPPAGGPWPASASFDAAGLTVAGEPAARLAERFGTPLLVVDEGDLRARCRAAADAFPHALFAIKAFPIAPVIRIAAEEGLGALAATDGELLACLRAGVEPSRLALHGNNKLDRELALAVEARIGLVVVDNLEELDRLDAIARAAGAVQPVLIRVIPDVDPETHRAIATGGAESKFGIPRERALEAVGRAIELPGLGFRGIHAHIGSQVLQTRPYLDAVDRLLDLLAELREELGAEVELLDVGGGFGVAYVHEAPPSSKELADTLLAAVREGTGRRDLPTPHTFVEPGRSLVANAALTLYRVGSIKRTPSGRTLLAVDGGMSDNIRPMLYGARYSFALAHPSRDGAPAPVSVVGRHCESGDVLAEEVELPADVQPGDLLAVAATGAYTYALASNYNRAGRPAIVAVGAGPARRWHRREDPAELDRLEVGRARTPTLRVPDGVSIRPAHPRDTASFLEMWRGVVAERRFVRSESVRHPPRAYRKRFRRSWHPDQAQLVALIDGGVIGHLAILREEHPSTFHVATLGLAVDAEHRGRGIGSALLAEALRWAREMGIEKVVLSVYSGNEQAVALYRRFGFAEEGRLVGHSRKSYGYEDEILMATFVEEGDG